LLQWFKKNGRDLPWRRTRDAYAIWVSEIMLQQTQVRTVIPYYKKFLRIFPTVGHLARSSLSKVLKTWEGLGYYSRARNLHRASQMVLNHFHAKVPDHFNDLLALPGIGRSTAGAILSFAYAKKAPILDGNAKRVLARLFIISGNLKKKGEDLLWDISESLLPKDDFSSFNQAMMDLGSMICTPKNPQCPVCPLHQLCKGKATGDPERYPEKGFKKAIPYVEAISAVIQKNEKVFLLQRPPQGLLGGLWEFPNWKVNPAEVFEVKLLNCIRNELGIRVKIKESLGSFKQTYSHFKLTLHVYTCRVLGGKGKGRWIPLKDLHLLPMSKIHRRIIHSLRVRS